jgi:acyl carrier protein phosphodiesterase
MNYLAHFYLSFDQEALIVGNLLGDFVRGRLDHPRNAHLHEGIKIGVLLHRHIDSFTDTHPITSQCRKLLPAQYSKISGVMLDMYFDYFLAKNFAQYHSKPLPHFASDVYNVLSLHRALLPMEAQLMLDSMIKYDWLRHYASHEGMAQAFAGMGRKYNFLKGIENADEELKANEALFEANFNLFFSDLTQSCKAFLG